MRVDAVRPEAEHDVAGLRVAVVRSQFNASVTDGLLAGALQWLESAGLEDVTVVDVPGAFELPVVAGALCRGHDAVVALGAVIAGETDHYDHVARAACDGLMRVAIDTGVPVGLGLLTVRDPAHAVSRSQPGPDNKGAEAASAAVTAAAILRSLQARVAGG